MCKEVKPKPKPQSYLWQFSVAELLHDLVSPKTGRETQKSNTYTCYTKSKRCLGKLQLIRTVIVTVT